MIKTKFSHRVLAVFLALNFASTIVPVNQLLANNNGPTAPEASSFEPVDATDMVNLVTGDLSYVLPLLNVPSPEGGYPLSLAYHGGIAMDQEASWVGLGWNLNPGAINRSVNGYPDDWGKTGVNEFFYDQGWTDEYYSLGVGATINGVSVGVGASWGSNKSLGGYVSLGLKGASVKVGSSGVSASYSEKGFTGTFSTNGIGVGYGKKLNGTTFYGSLNLNPASGLSGGFNVANSTGLKAVKSVSMGVNFDSKGNMSTKTLVGGTGVSSQVSNITSNDYDVSVSNNGFSLGLYNVYLNFNYKKIRYSLYKYNNLNTSGALYPYHSNYTKNENSSYLLKEDNFMDVNSLFPFDENTMDDNIIIKNSKKVEENNLMFPNYDKYTVNAQGISGSIKPSSYKEMYLSDRGRGTQNSDNIYMSYLSKPFDNWLDKYYDIGGYTNFYFENSFNSFLRVERGNILKPNYVNTANDFSVYSFFTNGTSNFSSDFLPDGTAIKNGNRKREGNFIETYKNSQIREGNLMNFIEAKNIDRSQSGSFPEEGIGAYKITTVDGKTYHYSLPVYNFELFYKNFPNENNEDQNFFEIQKQKPYATHWLLTAITGPDYVDTNNNGELDDNDYGYWIEFDYGKWTDGYMWKGPKDGYDETGEGDEKRYSYYWGRKQVYYLDAIKTRTHTALFVKDVRLDNKSTPFEEYDAKWVSGSFNSSYAKSYMNESSSTFSPLSQYYDINNNDLILPEKVVCANGGLNNLKTITGKKESLKYIDVPVNSSLYLKDILILENDEAIYDKSRGLLASELPGKIYLNERVIELKGYVTLDEVFCYDIDTDPDILGGQPGEQPLPAEFYTSRNDMREFYINQHQNILDVKDIAGTSIESKTQEIISFNYDYSLALNSINSSSPGKGRLALKEVNFRGKTGANVTPPYVFEYGGAGIAYNKDNTDDWGYHKTNPEAWSMNKIITPTGADINISYEQDSYFAEAAYNDIGIFKDITVEGFGATSTGDLFDYEKLKITFPATVNVSERFQLGDHNLFEFVHTGLTADDLNPYDDDNSVFQEIDRDITLKVTEVGSDYVMLKAIDELPFRLADSDFPIVVNNDVITFSGDQELCVRPGMSSAHYCYGKPVLYEVEKSVMYTDFDDNGQLGGGIRVSSIEVASPNFSLKTEYSYNNPQTNKISGITSYAPSKEAKAVPYVSELPTPMVTYGNVTIKNYDNNNSFLGKSEYQFETLPIREQDANYLFSLGNHFKVQKQQDENFLNDEVIANKYTIYNKLQNIGRLISLSSYNRENQLIKKIENHYKQDLDTNGQIGVTQETYKGTKRVKKENDEVYKINSSSMVMYPSVLEKETVLEQGFSKTTNFNKHDFLTGQVLEFETTDSKGNKFKTETIPAYTKYTNMGSKVDDAVNKNMLTQEAMSKTYLKVNEDWKETSVGITTWNNEWIYTNLYGFQSTPTDDNKKVWRKHKSYTWDGDLDIDGTLVSYTDNFDWNLNTTSQPSEWKQISEVTQYDHYSMPLELEDINGNKVSTKTGDNSSKVLATGNAGYGEMFYTGAEYEVLSTYVDQQVKMDNGATRTNLKFHTGRYGVEVPVGGRLGGIYRANTYKTGKYKISVWVHKENHENARVKGYPFNGEIIPAGDWVLMNHYITFSTNTANQFPYITSASGNIYIDDYRVHPVSSSMMSYVYNEWDELSYILNENNLGTYYQYDKAGRLIRTSKEVIDSDPITGGFKKVSENNYHYKNN
ncbi:hypothetical protein [Kordia sp.]|uniref:hypothetical protein n=1 Tax=Kordia sp. TaxID=1965332 RepID=UPI003B5B4366